jgi:hypothetical protein
MTSVVPQPFLKEKDMDWHKSPFLSPWGRGGAFTWESRLRDGKLRHFGNPNDAMRKVHADLLKTLLLVIENTTRVSFDSVTASLPGCSIAQNVARHEKSRYFYLTDLKDAFKSVDVERLALAIFFLEPLLGSTLEIEPFLRRFCMDGKRGGLVQGAPASPVLFNIYAAVWLDRYLHRLFYEKGIVYTRYMDDLTISSDLPLPKRLRQDICDIIAQAGFRVHRQKTHLLDLWKEPVPVTGTLLYWDHATSKVKRAFSRKFAAKAEEILSLPTPLMNKKDGNSLLGKTMYARYALERGELTRAAADLRRGLNTKLGEFGYAKREYDRRMKAKRAKLRGLLFAPGFLDELRANIPIEEVIGRKIKLSARSGRREYVGLCPFHNEKTPSFTVAAKKKFFHCFGCGHHGDAIDFLMLTSMLTFREAVVELAERYGPHLP